MKTKCVLCGKAKGKRACKEQNNALICPPCCASIRNEACEGCRHYATFKEYRISKQDRPKAPEFIIEINEETERAVNEALKLLENWRFAEAKRALDELMVENSHNHLVQYAMGVYYAVQEQYEAALVHFDNAVRIFPHFTEAYFNKALTHQKMLDIPNTLRAYHKILQFGDPKSDCFWKATTFLDDVMRLLPKRLTVEQYLEALDLFEQGFALMEEQNWEEAIRYFKMSIEINDTSPQPFSNMGICYSKLGQNARALAAYDKAIELDPDYEPALVNRAIVASLKEGERLRGAETQSVEYYRDRYLEENPHKRPPSGRADTPQGE